MLKIDNLCKKYGEKAVLENLSMQIEGPGVLAIMGASGIGKTTLLNIIANIEKPDSGQITTSFKKISYKFQDARLIEWLTAQENIEIVLDKENKPSAEIWLNAVGLGDSGQKYPNELSGGMQQRVALARALAYGGDLLLLDEPFGAVDTDTKEILIELVKKYAEKNSVIIVTHDISEAESLNARTIFIKQVG